MTTLKLSPATLNAPEYFAATWSQRATWLSVALWAAGQGIKRTIPNASAWLNKDWIHACGVSRVEVQNAAPLLQFHGNDLHIWQLGQKPAREKQTTLAVDESPEAWLASLASNPAYQGIDVKREHAKAQVWCATHGKKLTQRRFLAWLNRCETALPKSPAGGWKPTEVGGF